MGLAVNELMSVEYLEWCLFSSKGSVLFVFMMMIMVICVAFSLAYETVNFLEAVIISCPPLK